MNQSNDQRVAVRITAMIIRSKQRLDFTLTPETGLQRHTTETVLQRLTLETGLLGLDEIQRLDSRDWMETRDWNPET